MEIFIKPSQKVSLTERNTVYLKDVAEICCVPDTAQNDKTHKAGNISVLDIKEEKDGLYLVSALDMVKKLSKAFPEADIQCLGETETLIDYRFRPEKKHAVFEKIKIIFVCTVLFGGAMTAIMSFHSDAQIPAVFQNMYSIFFGNDAGKPYIIYIPYSLGLAVGIIMFFNHIGLKKISKDPTPIEVEMTTYEKESADSLIDRLGKEKNHGNN